MPPRLIIAAAEFCAIICAFFIFFAHSLRLRFIASAASADAAFFLFFFAAFFTPRFDAAYIFLRY